ncbi:hypothetical protein WA158_002892 [Blastocystis sp. Blastoise]
MHIFLILICIFVIVNTEQICKGNDNLVTFQLFGLDSIDHHSFSLSDLHDQSLMNLNNWNLSSKISSSFSYSLCLHASDYVLSSKKIDTISIPNLSHIHIESNEHSLLFKEFDGNISQLSFSFSVVDVSVQSNSIDTIRKPINPKLKISHEDLSPSLSLLHSNSLPYILESTSSFIKNNTSYSFKQNDVFSLLISPESEMIQPFTIYPSLPDGLTFNNITGEIKGQSYYTHSKTLYTLTYKNSTTSENNEIFFYISIYAPYCKETVQWPRTNVNETRIIFCGIYSYTIQSRKCIYNPITNDGIWDTYMYNITCQSQYQLVYNRNPVEGTMFIQYPLTLYDISSDTIGPYQISSLLNTLYNSYVHNKNPNITLEVFSILSIKQESNEQSHLRAQLILNVHIQEQYHNFFIPSFSTYLNTTFYSDLIQSSANYFKTLSSIQCDESNIIIYYHKDYTTFVLILCSVLVILIVVGVTYKHAYIYCLYLINRYYYGKEMAQKIKKDECVIVQTLIKP